jgi:hypothetical protein
MEKAISVTNVMDSEGTKGPQDSFLELFTLFVLVVYAGQGNTFVGPLSFVQNPLGAFIPVAFCAILAIRAKLAFETKYFVLMFGLAAYFIAISIKYKEIHPTFFLAYVYYFSLAYILIKTLGMRLFRIFERVNFYMAVISLSFWVLQFILGGDTLFNFIGGLPGMTTFSKVTAEGYNILLYSIQPAESSLLYNFSIPRNCGYAWEPGAFAVYLCMAIFVNLFMTNPGKARQTRLWVLIITLITTQSTTGYLIFIVMITIYLLRKRLSIIMLVLPFTVVAMIYVASLPFMSKKVINLIDDTKGINQLLEDYYGSETPASPQRFTSFIIAFVDFKANPILGIGVQSTEAWTYKAGANISTISGIGNLLAQFGLVGFLFFIILTIRSSIFFSRYFRYNNILLLFFIIVFISISYSILFNPLISSFWMFHLFAPEKLRALTRRKTGVFQTEPEPEIEKL